MLKALIKDSEEARNFVKFHSLRSPRNRIILADVVECEHSVLVIMPFLTSFNVGWMRPDAETFFYFFAQIIEVRQSGQSHLNAFSLSLIETQGMEFIHEHNVAFIVSLL